MATSMFDSILEMVTPEMKQALASRLGESQQAVTSGLGTSVAATLAALVNKAGDGNFMSQFMSLLSGSAGQNILGNLGSIASGGTTGGIGDTVNKFLPMLFGNQNQMDQAAGLIGQKAGISASNAGGLLRMAAPLVLGFLGKLYSSGTLNAGSLGKMLSAEAPNLQRLLPTGLFGGAVSDVSDAARRSVAAVEDTAKKSSSSALLWLGVAAALLLGYFVYRSLTGTAVNTQPVANATQNAMNAANNAANNVSNAANAAWASLGAFFDTTLPDGTKLNIPEHGIENKLLIFIKDDSHGVDKETWFDFDRLLFDTGKATLQPASQEQLRNIAAILKAYPKVKVELGGYTDNTGDKMANQKLSQDRAQNVLQELIVLGVAPERLAAQGYGQEHPVADNSTEEGRQKNRRISLRVTEK